MFTIETLREFFGWCLAINAVLFMVTSILTIALRKIMSRTHSKMFNLDESYLAKAYFQYLGQYKIALIVFNLVPYLALRVMG